MATSDMHEHNRNINGSAQFTLVILYTSTQITKSCNKFTAFYEACTLYSHQADFNRDSTNNLQTVHRTVNARFGRCSTNAAHYPQLHYSGRSTLEKDKLFAKYREYLILRATVHILHVTKYRIIRVQCEQHEDQTFNCDLQKTHAIICLSDNSCKKMQ